MTSRELHDRVGGFRQKRGQVFWLEDAAYIADIEKLGFGAAYLKNLEVLHAGGNHYAPESAPKHEYWNAYWKREIRKNKIKRALLRVPLLGRLNRRYGLFRTSEEPRL